MLITVKVLFVIRNYALGISPKIGRSISITPAEEILDSEAPMLLVMTISCDELNVLIATDVTVIMGTLLF